ncbi:MAG: oxaloacetate decarboxylase, partial [Dehalococcoidia bacterium]
MASRTDRAEAMRQRLRAGMAAEAEAVLAPFVWDAGQARFAVHAGHQAVYMTGFGTASTYGLPDIGLIGLEEMASNAARIAAAVDVPVIADADTGYGNAVNVAHTVERYEAAGVAGLHLEDQVWPKRCGFMAGKEVIPLPEAAQKVAAAVRARGDSSLVIIARTDALEPLGWDAVRERCRAFHESGADLVFVDGLKTVEDIERAAELLPDLPRFLNSHLMNARDARALNYRVVIQLGTLRAVFGALLGVYGDLLREGVTGVEGTPEIEEIALILGVARWRALEQEFAAPSRAGE